MKLPGFNVRVLGPSDRDLAANLFASDPNHAALVQSGVLAAGEADTIFTELPEGKTLADKSVFGISDAGGMIAVADLIRGYPTSEIWFLGLIFIAPRSRNHGLGRRMMEALCAHAAEQGGVILRLAVTDTNIAAQRFYARIGFFFAGARGRREPDGRVIKLHLMEKAL